MTTETDQVPVSVRGIVDIGRMPSARERVSVFSSTALLASVGPQLLLGHAPLRRRAALTIVGLATDTAYLASSQGDAAQKNLGSCQLVQGGQVIFLSGSSEVWAVLNSGVITVGISAEYEENEK